MSETDEERWKRIAENGGPILRPVESYYTSEESEPIQRPTLSTSVTGVAMKRHYCQALVEDRTIFFELSPGQLYEDTGSGDLVPICWEVEGQVFSGEMSLDDILTLDFQPEKNPS